MLPLWREIKAMPVKEQLRLAVLLPWAAVLRVYGKAMNWLHNKKHR